MKKDENMLKAIGFIKSRKSDEKIMKMAEEMYSLAESMEVELLDEDGKTYIHYSVADIMTDTGCEKNKVLKCLKGLEEDVCLIERKKQGQGRPDMIYVKNFAIEEVEEIVKKDSEVCNVNLKAYLLATLFNAGAMMSNYYRAEVNHDMPQFAG